MTRYLADSLGVREPSFRTGLRDLEAAHLHPNTDIRFSTEVRHAALAKIRALGLDSDDTTSEELYHVLQQRARSDDARLNRLLRTVAATHVSAEGDLIAGMVYMLQTLPDTERCFAVKNSVLKAMLKKTPPKKAMKQLGYRSVDSFLKHEVPAAILAAAQLVESDTWQRRFLDQYKQLQPTDFEARRIMILRPDSSHWRSLAADAVIKRKHNFMSFKEAGALVFLPLPVDIPAGTTLASLSLALHDLNQIRVAGTFLRLSQVRPDFGNLVQTVAQQEPRLETSMFGQPLPWQIIQRYYAKLAHHHKDSVFEPHIAPEDLSWRPAEHMLADIEPGLAFWKDGAHISLLHGHRPISFNVVDTALNCCNKIPYERQVAHYFRQSMWHELMLRYLDYTSAQQAVGSILQPQLAEELATV